MNRLLRSSRVIAALLVSLALITGLSVVSATMAKAATTPVLQTIAVTGTDYCHALAIKDDGSLWAWGSNFFGQLGNGNSGGSEMPENLYDDGIDSSVPIKVMGDAVDVATGYGFSLAVKSDGSLWAWGAISCISNSTTPVKVMDSVAKVAANGNAYAPALILKTDGSLWTLNTQTKTDISSAAVKVLDGVTDMAAGDPYRPSLALKSDGTLWQWNSTLSKGVLQNSTPEQIMDDVTAMAIGSYFNMVLKSNGDLFILDNNPKVAAGASLKIVSTGGDAVLNNVVSIAASGFDAYAVKTDGSLWSWGYNGSGLVGNGNKDDQASPVKIMDGVADVAANWETAMALKTDGSLWAWGTFMNLGSSQGILYGATPVKVMDGIKVPQTLSSSTTPAPVATPAPSTPAPEPPTTITITLNGVVVPSDQPPVNVNGRVLVPARAISEALGATVAWDDPTKTVTITKGDITILMTIDNPVIKVSGQDVTLDVPPQIINGRTLVPLRALAEALQANVTWDGDTQTVIIEN